MIMCHCGIPESQHIILQFAHNTGNFAHSAQLKRQGLELDNQQNRLFEAVT